MDKVDALTADALATIAKAQQLQQLQDIKVGYLGKKGQVTVLLKTLGALPAEQRRDFGQQVNAAKSTITQALEAKKQQLQHAQEAHQLSHEQLDITLPGRRPHLGGLHPVSRISRHIATYFQKLGFTMQTGPEIEDDYHNFTALNIPPHHPARAMHDTFYFSPRYLLRTHTSSVQIRTLKQIQPPCRFITIGKAFRCDSDMTHTPMFHQLEGFMLGEDVTFPDLKGILNDFLTALFEQPAITRLRSSYFPFTEPSAEMDIQCRHCNGQGCRICSHTGWLEVLGCGMIHPHILTEMDIDPDKYQGFAFGAGLDRLAMLKYGIQDLRLFFENDWQFLKQF